MANEQAQHIIDYYRNKCIQLSRKCNSMEGENLFLSTEIADLKGSNHMNDIHVSGIHLLV